METGARGQHGRDAVPAVEEATKQGAGIVTTLHQPMEVLIVLSPSLNCNSVITNHVP